MPIEWGVSAGPPHVLLQAVIIPAGKTPDGTLIQGVAPAWFEIIRLLREAPEILYKIDPRKMEELIAGAYQKAGFEEVVLTPRSGDFGRDVIAVKRGIGTVRVIDQVKAYKPGHRVTADDVRALMGVLHTDGAAKGFLTTTSDFAPKLRTDPLITPFVPSRLELVNGAALSSRLQELALNGLPAGEHHRLGAEAVPGALQGAGELQQAGEPGASATGERQEISKDSGRSRDRLAS